LLVIDFVYVMDNHLKNSLADPPQESISPPEPAELTVSEPFSLVDRPDRPIFYKIFEALEQKVEREDEELLLKNLSAMNEGRIILALKGLAVLGTPGCTRSS
jgi:hypothetical protein